MQTGHRRRNKPPAGSLPFVALGLVLCAAVLDAATVEFKQLSNPAGIISEQSSWVETATTVTTVNASMEASGRRFTHWMVGAAGSGGTRREDETGRALNPVEFVIYEATDAIAQYLSLTNEVDEDLIPDWFEVLFYNSTNNAPSSDTDADGFDLATEYARDYHPRVPDTNTTGGVSHRDALTLLLVLSTNHSIYRERSEPPGLMDSEMVVSNGTVVLTPNLHGETSGRTFGYWDVDGIIQEDASGRALSRVAITVTSNCTATAHYFPTAEDTDTDGIPDWYEWQLYATLSNAPGSDTDGDGFDLETEYSRDYHPSLSNLVADGGVSHRLSLLTPVNLAGYCDYTIKSDPAGIFSEQGGTVATGTVVTTQNLYGEDAGRVFGYWSVNGTRQADAVGTALSRVSLTLTGDTMIVAHYFLSDSDTDTDDIPDWFEWHSYGTLSNAPGSDTDGDAFTLEQEYIRGYCPNLTNHIAEGGVSHRLSGTVTINLQLFERVENVLVEGTMTNFFTVWPTNATGMDFGADTVPGVGDWDGDGDLDLFVVAAGAPVRAYENIGTVGQMNLRHRTNTRWNRETGVSAVALGNCFATGRKRDDLALAMPDGRIRLRIAAGGIHSPVSFWERTLNVGSPNPVPALADVTDDGRADLLVLLSDGTVRMYPNTHGLIDPFSEGTYTNDLLGVSVPNATGLSVGDVNKDGLPDVLVSDTYGRIWEFHKSGGSGYALHSKVWAGSGWGFANKLTLALADMDGDGDLDAIAGFAEGGLMYLRDPCAGPPGAVTAVGEPAAVRLTWSAAQADGYHVYRSLSYGGDYTRVTDPKEPSTTFSDTNVVPNTEYYYYVTSVTEVNLPGMSSPRVFESPQSQIVSASLPPVISANPTNLCQSVLEGRNGSNQTFQVWNSGSSMLSYSILCDSYWLTVTPSSGTSTGEHDTITACCATASLTPGVYNAAIGLWSPQTPGRTVSIGIQLTVNAQSNVIARRPKFVGPTVVEGESQTVSRSMEVWNASETPGAMSYGITDDAAWLTVSPTNGVTSGERVRHTIAFTNLSGLAVGVHTGKIWVAAGTASNSPAMVDIRLSVVPAPPGISVSTAELTQSITQSQTATNQTFGVWNGTPNGLSMDYTVTCTPDWLAAVPASGTSTGEHDTITVQYDTGGLDARTHHGTITIESDTATNSPKQVQMTLQVNPQPGVISLAPVCLAQTLDAGANAATQRISVLNAGSGSMDYDLTESLPWLSISPTNGTLAAGERTYHDVVFEAGQANEATHTGSLTIASADAVNSPQAMPVSLTVIPSFACSTQFLPHTVALGDAASNITFELWNEGSTNEVDYVLEESIDWLGLSPTNGSSAGEHDTITASFDTTNLAVGVHRALITLVPQQDPGAARRIVIELRVEPVDGRFVEKIVFASDRGGDWDIWMINPDGTGLEPLVQTYQDQRSPHVSPDGTTLAYSVYLWTTARSLWVRDLRTATDRRLAASYVAFDLARFEWHPDGTHLLLASLFWGSTHSVPIADHMPTSRLFFEGGEQEIFGVDWLRQRLFYLQTPRPRTFALIKRCDFGTGTTRTNLQAGDGWTESEGNCSLNGEYLIYEKRATGGQEQLVTLRTDGSDERFLDCGAGGRDPDFSPDGRSVVFIDLASCALCKLSMSDPTNTIVLLDDVWHYTDPEWTTIYVPAPEPVIAHTPATLSNTNEVGQNAPSQAFEVWNAGTGALDYRVSNDVPWLLVNPASGTSTGEHDAAFVDYTVSGLEVGSYTGLITIADASATNSPQEISVHLTVEPPPAVLWCSPLILSNSVMETSDAPSQDIVIWNGGGGSMAYEISDDMAWLSTDFTNGISAGEQDTAVVEYSTTNLAAGMYTGTITVTSADATNGPQSVAVALEVVPLPPPDPPVLAVSPTSLSNSTTEGRQPQSQLLLVSNDGGGVLEYTLAVDAAWLMIWPQTNGVSQGELDRPSVRYAATNLTANSYTATVTVASNGGTSSIPVFLTVEPKPQYTLTLEVEPEEAGGIIAAPAGGTYEEGTVVTVAASNAPGYKFSCWLGTDPGTNAVAMYGDRTVTAQFIQITGFGGRVTNAISGSRVANALIAFGTNQAQSSTQGYYAFPELPCGGENLSVTRTGYEPFMLEHSPPCFIYSPTDIGLQPEFVSDVTAAQRKGTNLVDITYTLTAPTNDAPVVSIELSTDGGTNWDVQVSTWQGDAGTNVVPGTNRVVVWHAGADWPEGTTTSAVIRVCADGSAGSSPVFTLDTWRSGLWKVRTWVDLNGNTTYDGDEALADAELYYAGRLAANRVGTTDSNGVLAITVPAEQGQILFARKRIHTEPAVKAGHEAVSNTMYGLWLDSDVGGTDSSAWDGTWRACKLSDTDIEAIGRHETVYLQLAHPVFEWNLCVATEVASSNFTAKLKEGFENASIYLYDATDGQMKFGTIAITSDVAQGCAVWTNADVVVYSANDYAPRSDPAGIHEPYDAHIYLGSSVGPHPPHKKKYYKRLVREFGHYALGLHYEDKNAFGRPRGSDYVFPGNHGVMDNPDASSEFSSYNDYRAHLLASTPRSNLTAQVYHHDLKNSSKWYPCWQWLEHEFERSYSGFPVEIVVPNAGHYYWNTKQTCYSYPVYVNQWRVYHWVKVFHHYEWVCWTEHVRGATSSDREGPDTIPQPYPYCEFIDGDGGLGGAHIAGAQEPGPLPQTALSAVQVCVCQDNAPVAGASVLRKPVGRDCARALGRTGLDGRVTVYDLTDGDVLETTRKGVQADLTVSPEDWADGRVEIVLAASPPSEPEGQPMAAMDTGGGPVSSTNLGIIVSGTLTTNRVWTLQIQANKTLTAAPSVTSYLDDGPSNAVPLFAAGGNLYTGSVALGSAAGGTLEIGCESTDAQTIDTIDGFQIGLLPTNGSTVLYSRDGWAELQIESVTAFEGAAGFLYQAAAPPVIPAGFSYSNQVGSALLSVLAEGSTFGPSNNVLNVAYQDGDVLGVIESTIQLHRWLDTTTNWAPVPGTLDTDQNTVSAVITNLGLFALFAHPSTDTNAPSAVAGLFAETGSNASEIVVSWLATGDDGTNGTAAAYILKYATEEISETNWASLASCPLELQPQSAGAIEVATLHMPDADVMYYFAIKAKDEAGNVSPLSELAAARSQFLDQDGDLLSDEWEASVGLDPAVEDDTTLDTDGDGLTTAEEFAYRTDPGLWDTDGDGMSDKWEIEHGLDPNSANDADGDPDGDGLSNVAEYGHGTNPNSADTDGDGLTDDWELLMSLVPFSASHDDGADADPDEDGFDNEQEFIADTHPNNPSSYFAIADVVWTNDGCAVQFNSALGRVYSVEYRTNLLEEGWLSLETNMAGSGGLLELIDTNDVYEGIYRIHVTKPE